MKRKFSATALLLVLVVVLTGCASSNMTEVIPGEELVSAVSDKALIHFLRPSAFGGAIQAAIYDGTEYIGTLSTGKRISYAAEPGEHMFMIVAESADFMQADLQAGKVYYAVAQARMGVWKARFSLRPMNGQVEQQKIDGWMESSKQVAIGEKGRQWAVEHQDNVVQMKEKYLPTWHAKPDDEKQILLAESGY